MKIKQIYISESGDLSKNGAITEPESTETRTSEYADFQVLPVAIFNESDVINFSVISNDLIEEAVISPQEELGKLAGKEELSVKLGERLGENEAEILREIAKNKLITATELSEKIGISTTAVENNISKLKEKGILRRVGPDKGGHWEIIK